MIAIIAASAALPESRTADAAFRGLAGAMMINALAPHTAGCIRYRRCCPGTATGLLLVWPAGFLVLREAVAEGWEPWPDLVLSTAAVGAVFMSLLPLLFRLARFVMKGREPDRD